MALSEEQIQGILDRGETIAQRMVRGETTLQIELGLTEEEMEAIYFVGYNLYANGKYEESMKTFSLLMTFNPVVYKYFFGFASSLQMTGQHAVAAFYYLMSTTLDEAQPAPFLHIGECLLKTDDRPGAMQSLERAIELSGDSRDFGPVKRRSQMILENLKKKAECA